jgi:DNA polymerase-3 subunit delta
MAERPVCVLAGPEEGKREDFVRAIRARMAATYGAPPEEHRLYSWETGVPEALSLATNGSLFSDAKLLRYEGAEAIKLKDDVAAIVAYAKAPAPDTVLLLITSDYSIDQKIEAALGRDAKQTFFEMFENEKERWVRDFFRKEGISIGDEAVDALLELVENDSSSLKAECSRIALFYPRGAAVSADDLETYLAHTRGEDAFSLFDRIAGSTPEHALETLETILGNRDSNGVQIVSGLVWSLRRLLQLHRLLESGEPPERAFLMCGIKSKRMQSVYQKARSRYSLRACERAVATAAEYDVRLRSSGAAMEKTLLYLFVHSLMTFRDPLAGEPLYPAY